MVRKLLPIAIIAALLILLFLKDWSPLAENKFFVNLKILTNFLILILPLFLFALVWFGWTLNKWAFKIEKLTLGGFNILFDNPVKLYKRSVQSFLDTKRTLFLIDPSRDNFDETLTSYYKTYEF